MCSGFSRRVSYPKKKFLSGEAGLRSVGEKHLQWVGLTPTSIQRPFAEQPATVAREPMEPRKRYGAEERSIQDGTRCGKGHPSSSGSWRHTFFDCHCAHLRFCKFSMRYSPSQQLLTPGVPWSTLPPRLDLGTVTIRSPGRLVRWISTRRGC